MATRACDVGAVAQIIGRDEASGLVGVSGFSGSDTALLVERLRERFEGSTAVTVDLLADADPREMTTSWASDQRGRLEQLRQPASSSSSRAGGSCTLVQPVVQHHDLDGRRIEDAVMAGRLRAFHEYRSRGGTTSAEWRANRREGPVPPRVEVDVREAELFARFRPDHGPTSCSSRSATWRAVLVRCFAEIGCDFLLWDSNNAYCGELEPCCRSPTTCARGSSGWARCTAAAKAPLRAATGPAAARPRSTRGHSLSSCRRRWVRSTRCAGRAFLPSRSCCSCETSRRPCGVRCGRSSV